MTLPSSGTIAAAMINVELGRAANASFSLGGAEERALAGVPSGPISFSNFYGKSAGPAWTPSSGYYGRYLGPPSSSISGTPGTTQYCLIRTPTMNWGDLVWDGAYIAGGSDLDAGWSGQVGSFDGSYVYETATSPFAFTNEGGEPGQAYGIRRHPA